MEPGAVDWIWHVIVTRSRLTSIIANDKNGRDRNSKEEEDEEEVLPIDTHAPNITLGWNLLILRLKPRQADDESDFLRQGTAILRGCPWVQSQVNGDTVFPGAIDLNILEQYEQEHEGPEDPLLVCPNATTNYFVAGARVLLKWSIFQNSKQEPLTLVQKALRHLKENPSSLLDSEPVLNQNLKSMMDKMGILETRLWQARSVPPAQIKFHLAPQLYDNMAFISEIQHTTRQLFPEAKQVVSGPCLRNSRVRIERIFWVIDFSTHMEHRYVRLYDGQKSSSAPPTKRKGQGSILPIGAEEYWGYGNKLINLPTDDDDNIITSRRKLKQLYRKSAQLLGARPWSHFTPSEVLKVNLTIHGVGDVTKYIQFRAKHKSGTNQFNVSDEMTNPSPMGEVRIFHTKEGLEILKDNHNQQTDHNSRNGQGVNGQNTGSMALISEDLSFVHYDFILLMEHLFGAALLTPELPDGIIPLVVAAQTLQTTEQPLSQNEMEWLQLCVMSIVDFIRDEHSLCEKNGRPIIRSYAVNKEGEPSAKGSDTVVTISYKQ